MKVLSGRDYIESEEWVLRKLNENEYHNLGWFDCDDEEINDFFLNDAILHKKELLAESYVYEYKGSPLALLSIQNDSVHFADHEAKERKKFGKKLFLHFRKRYNSIPAVKLGRIGVQKGYKKNGVGSNLLTYCKKLFITDNRTGCRIITVDAYNKDEIIRFYKKNGFVFLSDKDLKNPTRIMWCDLYRIEIKN